MGKKSKKKKAKRHQNPFEKLSNENYLVATQSNATMQTCKTYDTVIFWDLEWVYVCLKCPPKFGTKLKLYHIIDAAFLSHNDEIHIQSKINAGIDDIMVDNFVKQNGFLDIVKTRRQHPYIDDIWNELTAQISGDALFVSYGGAKDVPIDYLVLKMHLGDVVDRFDFVDARSLIRDKSEYGKGSLTFAKLSDLYRDITGELLTGVHQANEDTAGLKKILEKLDILKQIVN